MRSTLQNISQNKVLLNERTSTVFGGENYRFGFQNQEMDDEIKGEGNSVNYKYRMHDPRLGRFFAVDPLSKDYPWNSSYAFSENRVNDCVELEGKEAFWIHGTKSAWGADWSKFVHSGQLKKEDLKRTGELFGNKNFNRGFNWNGANSDKARHKAANDLVNHIIKTRTELIESGKISVDEPITLLGQSHGGNLAIEATNILIEKHGYKPEQFNIVALNTPREHDITLMHEKVKLYSVNAIGDIIQSYGGDGSIKVGSDDGPIHVLSSDAKIFYKDQLKDDQINKILFPIETNHNGWHKKNIDEWLRKLDKVLKKEKEIETK